MDEFPNLDLLPDGYVDLKGMLVLIQSVEYFNSFSRWGTILGGNP